MIKLFTDTADFDSIVKLVGDPMIKGFTTNPTLMKQAGIKDYKIFAQSAIDYLTQFASDTCLSLEVFADDYDEMYRQAKEINSWAKSYKVYVKIPVMCTNGDYNYRLIQKLNDEGVKVNVTALFTYEQITNTLDHLEIDTESIVSVFAGRIADAGYNPSNIISTSVAYAIDTAKRKKIEFLWASSREAYNYIEAEKCGCNIITMTPDLIKKVKGFGKDLTVFSNETVKMFYNDAKESGFNI